MHCKVRLECFIYNYNVKDQLKRLNFDTRLNMFDKIHDFNPSQASPLSPVSLKDENQSLKNQSLNYKIINDIPTHLFNQKQDATNEFIHSTGLKLL